ncbi:hypothetical protein BGZ68_001823 [Mortierella alpina]|nr:hypothetical protein BGZ68_001823 [Mortierella alpina]
MTARTVRRYTPLETSNSRRASDTSSNRSNPRNRSQVQRSPTADSLTCLPEPPPLYNGTALLPGEGAIIVEIPVMHQNGTPGGAAMPEMPPPSYSRSRTNVVRSPPLAAIIEMDSASAMPEPPAYPELSRGADTPQTVSRN